MFEFHIGGAEPTFWSEGMIGVLIGAFVSILTTFGVAMWSEYRASAKEKKENQKKLRMAARLVWGELSDGLGGAQLIKEEKKLPPEEVHFSATEWQTYKDLFARELSNEAWADVYMAIYHLKNLEQIRKTATKATEMVEVIEGTKMEKAMEDGMKVLEKLR